MNYLQILTSFKREFWEYKKSFLWTPLILAGLLFFLLAFHLLSLQDYQAARVGAFLNTPLGMPDKELDTASYVLFSFAFFPFMLIAAVLQIKYFLSCLFDERRDSSIYFWRSLPVSDAQTIAVKFFTGAIVIPSVFIISATVFILGATVLLLMVEVFGGLGPDGGAWSFVTSINYIKPILLFFFGIIPITLWMLPVFTWFMLCSMLASRAPFLWAVFPILGIFITEFIVVEVFGVGSLFFTHVFENYFSLYPSDAGVFSMTFSNGSVNAPVGFQSAVFEKVGLIPIGISMLFLGATYWLRINRSQQT